MTAVRITIAGLKELQASLAKLERRVKKARRTAIRKGAQAIQKTAIASIVEGGKSGRVYKRGGVTHQASAPGEAPAHDTGHLASNIVTVIDPDGEGASIVSKAAYSNGLEFGYHDTETGRRVAARPFMRPALEANRDTIAAEVRKAYATGGDE